MENQTTDLYQKLASLKKAKDLLEKRRELRERRECALESTVRLAELSGSNSHNPAAQKYPWMRFQEDIAQYLDKPYPNKPKPIKVICVPRGHLKTEIGVNFMLRHVLMNPETRNGICGATSDRGEANLSHINQISKSEEFQELFPDILYEAGTKARLHYTQEWMEVKRKGNYREKTITAFGLDSNTTDSGRYLT